jgi:hypothetical protein
LFDELISKFNHRPPESRMQTMAGCGALRASLRWPGWRPCPPLTHCASRMATSGPPCGNALGSPISPSKEPRPLVAFAVLSSARRTLRTPSPALRCGRGEVPWTKEPGLAVLHPRPAGLRPPTGACRYLLLSLEGQQCVGDVSVIHPGASTYSAVAAKTDSSAAARRDADKTALYRGYGAGCYRFVDTFGRHCGHLWPSGQAPDETHHLCV